MRFTPTTSWAQKPGTITSDAPVWILPCSIGAARVQHRSWAAIRATHDTGVWYLDFGHYRFSIEASRPAMLSQRRHPASGRARHWLLLPGGSRAVSLSRFDMRPSLRPGGYYTEPRLGPLWGCGGNPRLRIVHRDQPPPDPGSLLPDLARGDRYRREIPFAEQLGQLNGVTDSRMEGAAQDGQASMLQLRARQ